MVRVTVEGRDLTDAASDSIPDVSTPEKLALCAFVLHRAVLQRAAGSPRPGETGSTPHTRDGADGWLWRGFMNTVMEDIWVGLRADIPETHAFKRELNRWLNASNNLVCVERGTRTAPSVWFVRADYNDIPPGVPQAPPLSRAAQRLTPAEAGEDREPAPVDTGFVCTWIVDDHKCGQRFGSASWLHRHIYEEHRSAESWLTEAMEALGKPATITQIHQLAAGAGDYPGSDLHTGVVLHSMFEAGLVACDRPEEERGRHYFIATRPVSNVTEVVVAADEPEEPQDDERVYRCREPGCRHVPFSSYDQRHQHEDTVHADSPARTWKCSLCQRRFYGAHSFGRHLSMTHRLKGQQRTEAWNVAAAAAMQPAAPAPVAVAAAPGDLTSTQVANWLTNMLEENQQLHIRVNQLTGENQQMTARLRRMRNALEDQ